MTPKQAQIINKAFYLNATKDICDFYNLPLPPKAQTLGVVGEAMAYSYYKDYNKDVRWLSYDNSRSPFDLEVNGVRVEVKTAVKGNKERYSVIFKKNMKGNLLNFDVLCVVLFSEPTQMYIIAEIPASRVQGLSGINWTLEKFKMYLIK